MSLGGKVTLVPCPACKVSLVLVDGKIRSEATFFMRDGKRAMTPHAEDCEYRGKETPRDGFTTVASGEG